MHHNSPGKLAASVVCRESLTQSASSSKRPVGHFQASLSDGNLQLQIRGACLKSVLFLQTWKHIMQLNAFILKFIN